MGFRDYSPGLNRYLARDSYNGALADFNLATDPWTGNRYAFAGGNPVTNVEIDGHCFVEGDKSDCDYNPDGSLVASPVGKAPRIVEVPRANQVPPIGPWLRRGGIGVIAWCVLFCLAGDSPALYEGYEADTSERERNCLDSDSPPTEPIYYPLDTRKRAQGAEACIGPWSQPRGYNYLPDPPGYGPGMNRSHLIADRFGGHPIRENLVPLYRDVNQIKMKAVERKVATLRTNGRAERLAPRSDGLSHPPMVV